MHCRMIRGTRRGLPIEWGGNTVKTKGLTRQELSAFCAGVSVLLGSGSGMEEAVGLYAEDSTGALEAACKAMVPNMSLGFGEAAAQTGRFPDYALAVMQTAEASGRLEEGLGRLAEYYDRQDALEKKVRSAVTYPAALLLLLGGVLFTVQLYADFSGYTDIVLGVGEVLGLHLPENFRQPFFADSVKDIWARWHISLSQWLRDYIYIPLGGSRCSKARKDGNLIITFLVSGLWHGAGLTYLVWGGLHGLCQAAENHLPPRRPGKLRHALRVAGTFCILAGAFVIFRASSLANAAELFKGILCNGGHAVLSNYWELGLTSLQEEILLYAGIAILLAVDAAHERGVSLRTKIAALPTPARWAIYEVCIFVFLFMGRFLGGGSFLYARY